MKKEFDITTEDIKNGLRDTRSCPISLAINRKYEKAQVSTRMISFDVNEAVAGDLRVRFIPNEQLKKWIAKYDAKIEQVERIKVSLDFDTAIASIVQEADK